MRLLREASDNGKQINLANLCFTLKWHKWLLAQLSGTIHLLGSVQSNAHDVFSLLRLETMVSARVWGDFYISTEQHKS